MTVAEVFISPRCAAGEHNRCRGWRSGHTCGCHCGHLAAANVLAAGVIALRTDPELTPHPLTDPEALLLLDMLGLVDEHRTIQPDHVRHGRLINEQGYAVAAAPAPSRRPPAKKAAQKRNTQPPDLSPPNNLPGAGGDRPALAAVPAEHDPRDALEPSPAPPEPAQEPRGLPEAALYPVDVDDWLAAAQQSPRVHVRSRANAALVALLQLRCALDDLARAERST